MTHSATQKHSRLVFLAAMTGLISSVAFADITTTGYVDPASVTTGLVVGQTVFVSDPNDTGSLTVDGGSSLLVDNPDGGIGIGTFFNAGEINISAASLEVNARTAMFVNGGGTLNIDNGSYVLLNGSDDRNPDIFNRGRALNVASGDNSGYVHIDGAGTRVDLVRRLNIKSTGFGSGLGAGILTISNGATLTQDSSDSSLVTGFTVGSAGIGQVFLFNHGTLQSLSPSVRFGNSGESFAHGELDILFSSSVELTTAFYAGAGNGSASISVHDSSFAVLADPLEPVPETGNLYAGLLGGHADIFVDQGIFDVAGQMYIAIDDPASTANVAFHHSSIANIGEYLGISHNGASGGGHGNGYLMVCDSILTVPIVRVGPNGTLAVGGPTGTANIVADIRVSGGTIAPGCSPGEMTVAGNVDFEDGELVIEVNNVDNHDVLTVLGDLEFLAGTVLFSFANGYAPQAGDSFDFLGAASTAGTEHLAYEFEGLQEGFEFEVGDTGAGLGFTALTDGIPEFVSPHIDIRPGEANVLNISSSQLFPVAILTTQDEPIFDATKVDPATVVFGPAASTPDSRKTQLKDVDGDGDLDLRLWFRVQDAGFSCDDSESTLEGLTYDNTEISASDTVIIEGCN